MVISGNNDLKVRLTTQMKNKYSCSIGKTKSLNTPPKDILKSGSYPSSEIEDRVNGISTVSPLASVDPK